MDLNLEPIGQQPLNLEPVPKLDLEPVELPVENKQHPALSTTDRLWIQNVAPDEDSAVKWLQKKGWVARNAGGEVQLRQPTEQKWHKVEAYWSPELADVGDVVNEVFSGVATGVGSVFGGILGAGAGAAGAETVRRGVGAAAGFEQTLPEAVAGIAEEGALGAAFEAGGKLVGKGYRALKGKVLPRAALPKAAPAGAAAKTAAEAEEKLWSALTPEEKANLKSIAPEYAAKVEADQAAGKVWQKQAGSTGEEIYTRGKPTESFEALSESYYRQQDAAMKALGGQVPKISEWVDLKTQFAKPWMFGFKNEQQARNYITSVARSEDNLDHLFRIMDLDPSKFKSAEKAAYLIKHYKDLERAVIDPRIQMVKLVNEATKPAGGKAYTRPVEVVFRKREGDMRRMVGTTRFPPSGLPKTKVQIFDEVMDRNLTVKELRDRVLRYTNQGRPISKKLRAKILKADIPELVDTLWGFQKGAFKGTGMNFDPKKYGLIVLWDLKKKMFRMMDTEFVQSFTDATGKTFRMDDLKNLLSGTRQSGAYKLGSAMEKTGRILGAPERFARRALKGAATSLGVEGMPGKALTTIGAYGLGGWPGVVARWTPDVLEGIGRRLMRDPDWAGTKVANMAGKLLAAGGANRLGPYLYTMSRNDPRLRGWLEQFAGEQNAVQE